MINSLVRVKIRYVIELSYVTLDNIFFFVNVNFILNFNFTLSKNTPLIEIIIAYLFILNTVLVWITLLTLIYNCYCCICS